MVKDWEEDKSGKGLDGGIDKDETDEGNISDVETGIKVSEGKGSDRKVEWELGEGVVDCVSKVGRLEGDIVEVDTLVEEGVVPKYGPRTEGWLVEWRYNKLENQGKSKDKEEEEAGEWWEVRVEKGNLDSLKMTCLEVYKHLVTKYKHK